MPMFSLPGYDHWKTTEPDPNADYVCDTCGYPFEMSRSGPYVAWVCARCDEPEPLDEPDYDAWAKEQP